jgi:hypothetical protein
VCVQLHLVLDPACGPFLRLSLCTLSVFVGAYARSRASSVSCLVAALSSLPLAKLDKFLLLRFSLQARLTLLTRVTKRVKNIDIMHHFARDHVASGELMFLYCKSEDNGSDCLTKALPQPLFQVGLVGLGMLRV